MEIHVARDGSALGVFSQDEVRQGLASGRFRGSDLGWRSGMSAWEPLSRWSEFAADVPTAAPAADGAVGIEWETRPSLGALLRGIWMTVTRPAGLAAAKLGFGRSLGGAYLALLVGLLPFLALLGVNQQVESLQMEALAGFVESFNPDAAAGIREAQVEAREGQEDLPAFAMICGVTCVFASLPLLVALVGLLHWPLYRMLGVKAPVERVVSGETLAFVWIFVGMLPVSLLISLLGFLAPGTSLLIGALFQLTFLALQSRAMGYALGCGFWRALGVKLLLGTLCCACGCCIGLLIGLAGAGLAG